VAITVALADKLDTLIGFWAIDEKPTGSKDPFALRRAALGVIRIILILTLLPDRKPHGPPMPTCWKNRTRRPGAEDVAAMACDQLDLLSFFHDRLKVYLRDQGARHDLIDAVLTPETDDLLMVARRVEALTAFITSEDGKNLLAGTKRATQLLAAEEKKGTVVADGVSAALLKLDAEKELFAAITKASAEASDAIAEGGLPLRDGSALEAARARSTASSPTFSSTTRMPPSAPTAWRCCG
jgi:glycyl-tRNA synthetase beta chain